MTIWSGFIDLNFLKTDMIKRGCLARKQSIDLLDGLDFDFLNGMKTEDDIAGVFDDDMMFDFAGDHSEKRTGSVDFQHRGSLDMYSNHHRSDADKHVHNRTASMDSNFSGNFRMFDNLPMFRAHSFGDEANLISATDIDNLYNEDERYDAMGEHGLYSIGSHAAHSYYGDSAALAAVSEERKLSDLEKQRESSAGQQEHVELSAYEAHAASLRNGGVPGKNSLKGTSRTNVSQKTHFL